MSLKLLNLLFIICIWCGNVAMAQQEDTLTLTLPEIEKRFVENNLQLLVQRYEVDIAVAAEMTARLFANPNFSFSNGLYTKTKDTNALSQQTYGISQLIQTAGKRNKNIQLARINTENTWHQFFDLLRTLKYSLRSNLYTLFLRQQSVQLYHEEIRSLQKTLAAFQLIYQKGNIAEKEVLRIQSHDLKVARSNITYAGINLKLQKAMNYPDLTVSLNYDKKTGYGLGYVSGGVAMGLPLFNRNQGNIRQARVQLEQSRA